MRYSVRSVLAGVLVWAATPLWPMGGPIPGSVPGQTGAPSSTEPDTPLQGTCLAAPDLDCLKAVSQEMAGQGGPSAGLAYVAVIARTEGMAAAEDLLRAQTDTPQVLSRQIAYIAALTGDMAQARAHLPLGWPGPAAAHRDDPDRFTVLYNITRQAIRDGENPRKVMRYAARHWVADPDTGYFDMPEKQRIAFMNLFSQFPGARPGAAFVKMLAPPGGTWGHPPNQARMNTLLAVATADLTQSAQAMDAQYAGFSEDRARDQVRMGLVTRLLVAGDGEKATQIAQRIEAPVLGLFSRFEIVDAQGIQMSDAARLDLLDQAPGLDTPFVALPDLALRYHLLREVYSGAGPTAETDAALSRFLASGGGQQMHQNVELLARAGRLQDGLNAVYHAPDRAITLYTLIAGLVGPPG